MTDADPAAAMTRPDANDEQYADPARLRTRASIWLPAADGEDPKELAVRAVVARSPERVVEIGCGTGWFSARVARELPGCPVTATDRSPGMVAAARELGVPALVAEADRLPFPDHCVDVVAALWMLYHVPDLHAALRELTRVLRPGGALVAVTNGDRHLADLLVAAGGEPLRTQFSSENAERVLAPHFADVRRYDVATRAAFPDHEAARAYLATVSDELAASLPAFEGPRTCVGHTTVLVATGPRRA